MRTPQAVVDMNLLDAIVLAVAISTVILIWRI
jgi:hypothetical protein